MTVRIGPAARRLGPVLLRLTAAFAVLVLLGHRIGAAPFQDGLRAVTLPAVGAAAAITAVTTLCSAWRWRVVARALGVGMPLSDAVGAYYRSQFLNSVLPGGVVGDVHRAVAHGRRAGDLGRGARAVSWERFSGQVIQALVTAVALSVFPSPVRPVLPIVLACVVGVVAGTALVVRVASRRGRSRPAAVARAVVSDVRHGLLARRAWPQLALSSVLVVVGHTTTFVLAARIAGCTAPTGELVALAMLVQTATVIPLSVGGWGPREGVAAWAFAAVGFGAASGVTVSTVYAVLSLVAVAPGACLLLADAARRVRTVRRTTGSRRRTGVRRVGAVLLPTYSLLRYQTERGDS
ncbi:MAG TPA: lysylphosphatidylglycerol synthase transmembrane domain-containing protein [Streptosporangiales bacterium]